MYKMILEIIAEKNPGDFQAVLDAAQKYPKVKEYIQSDNSNQILINDMQNTLTSMMDDGLITGVVSPMKYVTLIKINGLTILGFQYLKKLKEETAIRQIKTVLENNGQNMTPATLTSALSEIIF